MTRRFSYFRSTIGHKQMLAVTGTLLYLFMFIHLVENLTLILGDEWFNGYVHLLQHNLKLIFFPLELGLLTTFLTHIYLAFKVTRENQKARPEAYGSKIQSVKSTIFSRTMLPTGLWLFIFLVVHIGHFRFGITTEYIEKSYQGVMKHDMYSLVVDAFKNPMYLAFYLVTFLVLSWHLVHGVPSSLQTFGLHLKSENPAKRAVLLYPLLLLVGFTSLAFWVFLN